MSNVKVISRISCAKIKGNTCNNVHLVQFCSSDKIENIKGSKNI